MRHTRAAVGLSNMRLLLVIEADVVENLRIADEGSDGGQLNIQAPRAISDGAHHHRELVLDDLAADIHGLDGLAAEARRVLVADLLLEHGAK